LGPGDGQRPPSAEGFRNLTYEPRRNQHSPNLVCLLLRHFQYGNPQPTSGGNSDFFNTIPQYKIIHDKVFHAKDIPSLFGPLYPGIACIKIQLIVTKTDEPLPTVFRMNGTGTAQVYRVDARAGFVLQPHGAVEVCPGLLDIGFTSEIICRDDEGNWDDIVWTDLLDILRRVGAALYNCNGVRRDHDESERILMSLRLRTPADGGVLLYPHVDCRAGVSSLMLIRLKSFS
jgi:hypothetical protein